MARAVQRERDLLGLPVAKPKPALEFRIHCMVARTLRLSLSRGWKFNHIASGEFRTKVTAGRLQAMGVMPGWPDFILFDPRRVAYFLELKRAKGGYLTPAQAEFKQWNDAAGGADYYCVARGYPEAINALKAWGAVRATVSA